MITILCHVSDTKYDILIPQPPENAICFSEQKFITYFGQFLYLFDLEVLKRNFRIQLLPTIGLAHCIHLDRMDYDKIKFESQSLKYEWRIYESIDVKKYAIGVIEHWNHGIGKIGKYRAQEAIVEVAINIFNKEMITI